jgi:glycosyltransferase involved in cell wall biosynthesis
MVPVQGGAQRIMADAGESLPRISIVVPSYNQGRFLGQALDSIFRQDYPAVEVVVMDGGSTDGSVEVIRSCAARLAHWQSGPDGGQAAAINAGVRRCTGTLVAWLNSDDFYCDGCLWTVADAYARLPGRGLYVGNGFRYDDAERRFTPFCRRHLALDRAALVQGVDYVLQPATFFLREAWDAVGGLDPRLHFCLDWDLIIRVARRYPAVLVNEFLAASREYEETKTRGGGLGRALEICRMLRRHTDAELTTGGLYYLFATLLHVTEGREPDEVRRCLAEGMNAISARWRRATGHDGGFPERGDPQDEVHLPLPGEGVRRPRPVVGRLPAITVISAGPGDPRPRGVTVESVVRQDYPRLEVLVADGPGLSLAGAFNEGLTRATGEVLGLISAGDVLTQGALHEVGAAFAADPELDAVFGNALYVDEALRPRVVTQGAERTAFCYGEAQAPERLPLYWEHTHAVPQPTVFIRRRVLEHWGRLDESFRHLFAIEFWSRLPPGAKVAKLERALALCRVPAVPDPTEERARRAEWYRFSRPRWPSLLSPEGRRVWRSYVADHVCRQGWRGPWRWCGAAVVAAVALLRLGNPETWPGAGPASRSGLRRALTVLWRGLNGSRGDVHENRHQRELDDAGIGRRDGVVRPQPRR